LEYLFFKAENRTSGRFLIFTAAIVIACVIIWWWVVQDLWEEHQIRRILHEDDHPGKKSDVAEAESGTPLGKKHANDETRRR
jgi:hypothetical protein